MDLKAGIGTHSTANQHALESLMIAQWQQRLHDKVQSKRDLRMRMKREEVCANEMRMAATPEVASFRGSLASCAEDRRRHYAPPQEVDWIQTRILSWVEGLYRKYVIPLRLCNKLSEFLSSNPSNFEQDIQTIELNLERARNPTGALVTTLTALGVTSSSKGGSIKASRRIDKRKQKREPVSYPEALPPGPVTVAEALPPGPVIVADASHTDFSLESQNCNGSSSHDEASLPQLDDFQDKFSSDCVDESAVYAEDDLSQTAASATVVASVSKEEESVRSPNLWEALSMKDEETSSAMIESALLATDDLESCRAQEICELPMPRFAQNSSKPMQYQ
jgi:hypothetical protein